MRSHHNRPPRARGIMFIDAVIAMGIAGTLLLVMGGAMGQYHRANRSLDDSRAALNRAEAALAAMHAGTPAADADPSVHVQPAAAGAAPPGLHWVELTVREREQTVSITALVPARAALTPATRPAQPSATQSAEPSTTKPAQPTATAPATGGAP